MSQNGASKRQVHSDVHHLHPLPRHPSLDLFLPVAILMEKLEEGLTIFQYHLFLWKELG